MSLIQRRERRTTIKVKGRPVETVREQYLRSDVMCQSALCHKCVVDRKCTLLPKDVTHYLIPFMDVAMKYMEILEFPEIRGIIFYQTLLQKVAYEGGRSLINKFNKILQDSRKECIAFLNEFCVNTYTTRNDSEGLSSWQARSIYNMGQWYSFHLDRQMPIVLVTENEEVISTYESETEGVYVISLGDYLHQFWPDLTIAHDIYESLTTLLTMEPVLEMSSGYREYLPVDVLEAGLKNGLYYEGRLKVSKYHSQDEAFVVPISSGMDKASRDDVLISGMKDRNRAIHGYLVYVELLPKSLWKGKLKTLGNHEGKTEQINQKTAEVMPTGRIVGIKQRNWKDYIACLPQEENYSKKQTQDRILVIPFDYRIPKIRILTRQAASLKDDRIVVRIDFWDLNSQYPNGHFVRSVGKIGDIETESMTLIVENCINILPFPARVNDEMPLDTGREILDVNGRRDLRNSHLICSIDPKGCEDVDDALSVQRLPNGLMELGVHIADVTHYVLPNSFTDLEARARATTVYLSEKRYDMLPSCLSSNLCSLLSSVDRYAVSILWTLDNNCHITDVWFGRTVIRSSYKLFYELAQEIVNGDAIEMFTENCQEVVNCNKVEVEKRFYQLRDDLTNLTDIARTLKIQRLSEGALELENDEVQFEFEDVDRTQIARLRAKQSLEIHETVAECMIFANQWVAMKIYDAFPTKALLRRHPEPGQEQFEHLRLLAQFKGFEFNTANNIQLSESLNKCIDPDDHCVNKLMRSLVIHAMKPATYFSTGSFCPEAYYHYGLALEYYTHFTSPIRRYADILVHRLLLAIAENNTTGAGIFDNRVLEEICEHINENQLAAKHVQRQSRELFHAFYFASLPLEDKQRVTDAIVYAIRANGVLVYVPKYAIKGPVYIVNKDQKVAFVKGDRVEWTSGRIKFENFMLSILASDGGIQSYKLFDHITVCVVVVSSFAHAPTVKLDIINNRPHPDRQIAAVSDICGKTFSEQVHALHKGTNMKTKVEGSLNQSNFNKKSIEESLYTVIEDLLDLALKTPKS